MAGYQKNTVHRLDITGCTAEGQGIARLDGLVVFVAGALAGETCEVRLLKVTKKAAWGKIERLLTPSPARIAPDCPHFGKCGGCQLRHMSYEEELRMKRARVDDALARIGGLALRTEEILGAEDTLRYRNKVQFPVAPGKDGGADIGFFRARTHTVIPVEDCLLQPEATAPLRRALGEWMANYHVPAYDETAHTGLVRHLYVRANRAGQLLCCVVVNGEMLPHEKELTDALRAAAPRLAGIVLNSNRKQTNVILGDRYRTLWGADTLEEELCGLTFTLSVPSFFQVNRAQTERLYAKAVEFAGLTGSETVLDLYCGIGTISLTMASRGAGRVLGAEIVPQAITDAKENARRNGLSQRTEFFCADAGEAAAMLAARGLRPDVISVDPPRKGLSPQVIDAIADMAPGRVVYVSCDPATLARDLALLVQKGYDPQRAAAVDMFPRTAHVETVVLLSRNK